MASCCLSSHHELYCCRLSANGLVFFGIEQRYLLKWLSLVLCVAVIMFGLGCVPAASWHTAWHTFRFAT